MNKNQFKNISLVAGLLGLVIGMIVLFVLFISGNSDQSLFNFKTIATRFWEEPAYIVMLFLPLWLFLLGLLAGFYFKKKMSSCYIRLQDYSQTTSKLSQFARQLREGNLNAEYELQGSDDILGKSLLELKHDLIKNDADDKKRREEDKQRAWTSEGLALFADILRQNNDDLNELSFSIIKNIVNYLKANQAYFFLLNDEQEKSFDLTACFAYDRKKYKQKRINWGEGLVGAAALENKAIFLTDIPENYVAITSGVGEATPRCLSVIPLTVNDEPHGVIEIASFQVFKQYEIDFLGKLADSIASTIATVKTNVRTNKLLKESQEQAEKLATQEEVMRQNMEELQTAQEEAAKQGEELTIFTNSVNHTFIRAEYQTSGTLIYANTRFLKGLGYESNREVEGRHISMFVDKKDLDWFNEIWDRLAKGGRHFEGDMKHLTKQGKEIWTMATYTCVRNPNDGTVEKILFLAIDITDQKKKDLDFKGQINALNRATLKSEFLPDGGILNCNEKFLNTLNYTMLELKDKTVFAFIDKNELKEFREIWSNVVSGIPFEGQIKMMPQAEEPKWFQGNFTIVEDMYGELAKIIFIANEITEQKKMEMQTQLQTEQLKKQEEDLKDKLVEIEQIKLKNEKTLEGAVDAIITINQNGTIEFFNHAAEELWELKRENVLGKNIRILVPDEYLNKQDERIIEKFLKSDVKQLVGVRKEVNIVKTTGEKVPVLLLLAEAKVGEEYTFTAFIQNISVDLF